MKILANGRYATVTSTLALLVALGGTTYAAASITGKDIKNNTVSSKDIKNRTVKTKDLAGDTRTALTARALMVRTSQTTTLGDPPKELLELALSPGQYVVHAKVFVQRVVTTGVSLGYCHLYKSTDVNHIDSSGADAPEASGAYAHVTNMAVISTSQPIKVTLACGGSNAQATEKKLLALQVGSVTETIGPDVARPAKATDVRR